MAVAQRLDPCLHDVVGRAEIGLADAEIDDVAPFGGEFLRAGKDDEGGFRAKARQALGEVQVCHGVSFDYRRLVRCTVIFPRGQLSFSKLFH